MRDHAVAVVDGAGVARDRFVVAHRAADLRRLVIRLHRAGVEEVAIERGDGPVVDALVEGGFTVFVIAPNQLKNLRSRYGQAGNKDDRFDAFVPANTLRTDQARLRPLTRDCEQTLTLRMTVRARQDLVTTRGRAGQPAARASGDHSTSSCAARSSTSPATPTTPIPGPTSTSGRGPRTRPPPRLRIPARAWLHVIRRCWQDNVPYDPTKHRALQAVLDRAA